MLALACLRAVAWVVWISKSNRSELKEKERPGSYAGPLHWVQVYRDDDSRMEVTAPKVKWTFE